jgi:hypothetical protein
MQKWVGRSGVCPLKVGGMRVLFQGVISWGSV